MCCLALLSTAGHREQVAAQAADFTLEQNLGSHANGTDPQQAQKKLLCGWP